LNSIRLGEDEVRKIADERRASNGDVSISKCTDCPAKALCHSTFGCVDIDGTEIGLYPFSRESTPRVLELIESDESSRYSANQRGLLMGLLSPIMSDVDSLEQNSFPNVLALPVRVTDPYYWTAFQHQYLGNYSKTERSRLRILAGLWIEEADKSDQAASLLKQYLEPLQLPAFTKEAKKVAPQKTVGVKPAIATGPKLGSETKDQVKKHLDLLGAWLQGEPLKEERYFRGLLSSLIKNSIRWDNHLQPAQFISGTWKVVTGLEFILIEGQPSSVKRPPWYKFPREETTRSLLEALCRHDKEGGKSWDFELGQTHNRVVANWIRNNESKIVGTLEPEVERSMAIKTATQFLSLYHVVRTRNRLPQKSIPDLMKAIFDQKWEAQPTGLSGAWNSILKQLDERHEQVLNFLKNEISVRQGRTGGINFVSPLLVLENAKQFNETSQVSTLDDEFHSNFWKSRFSGLPTNQFSNLFRAIEDERSEVAKLVAKTHGDLVSLGFTCEDTKTDLKLLFDQIVDLTDTIRQAKVTLPDDEYDNLVRAKTFTEQKMLMANTLGKAEKVATSKDPFDLLTFDPTQLVDCCSIISIVARRVANLDTYIAEQEEEIKKDGDPEAITNLMFESLAKFSELSEDILEVGHVKAS